MRRTDAADKPEGQHPGDRRRSWRPVAASLLALLALLGAACTTSTQRARTGRPGFEQRGLASWYGPGFHGELTANGEVYDMQALTAAHKHLPFESVVEVKNRANGRTVRVRINDRGPFVRGRIIDLSKAAAQEIDLVRAGVAEVTIRVVRGGDAFSPTRRSRAWLVQAGAFRNRSHAQRQLELVARVDSRAQLTDDGDWIRIVIGPFSREKEARRAAATLQRNGLDALVRSVS